MPKTPLSASSMSCWPPSPSWPSTKPPRAPTLVEPEIVPATTDTTAATESVTTTSAPVILSATGRVYLDVDGDGVFTDTAEGRRADQGLRSMTLYLYDASRQPGRNHRNPGRRHLDGAGQPRPHECGRRSVRPATFLVS